MILCFLSVILGLKYLGGKWIWTNDWSEVQYSKWLPGCPDSSAAVNSCGYVQLDYGTVKSSGVQLGYFNGPCTEKYPAICKVPLQ